MTATVNDSMSQYGFDPGVAQGNSSPPDDGGDGGGDGGDGGGGGGGKKSSKKKFLVLLLPIMVIVMMLVAISGRGSNLETPPAALSQSDQITAYITATGGDPKWIGQAQDAGTKYSVPWPILLGISYAATSFGMYSPYSATKGKSPGIPEIGTPGDTANGHGVLLQTNGTAQSNEDNAFSASLHQLGPALHDVGKQAFYSAGYSYQAGVQDPFTDPKVEAVWAQAVGYLGDKTHSTAIVVGHCANAGIINGVPYIPQYPWQCAQPPPQPSGQCPSTGCVYQTNSDGSISWLWTNWSSVSVAYSAHLVGNDSYLPSTSNSCGGAGAGVGGGGAPGQINQTEAQNVATIIGIGKTLGAPQAAWVVAITTAMTESSLGSNPAIYGGASGLFQQTPPDWGTFAQVDDPKYGAEAFYGAQPVGGTTNSGLIEVANWQSLPVYEAAQAVQGSGKGKNTNGALNYGPNVAQATTLAAQGTNDPAIPLEYAARRTFTSTGPASPVSASGGCGSGGPQQVSATPGVYYNPLRGITGLTPERVDNGVDYAGTGPLYAIGDGVVVSVTNTGWPGNAFIAIKLTDGPATGAVVYEAENIAPAVIMGQQVTANTVLGTLLPGFPHLETGWATPSPIGTSLAIAYGSFVNGSSAQLGLNFNQLLIKLGAPSGVLYPAMGTLPAGWPTW